MTKNKKPKAKAKDKALQIDKGGRPTKYNELIDEQVYELALLGLTDIEMANVLRITERTFNNWKKIHEGFFQSLTRGKESADAKVAKGLFTRAVGYSYDENVYEKGILTKVIVKEIPPDPSAALSWLKNRQPKKWRDKQEVGLTDKDGNDVNPVTIFLLPDNGRGKEDK